MQTTTTYSFGDIVLVPFPFTDQTSHKKRPATIISTSAYNAAKPDVVIMAVTGRVESVQTLGECSIGDWRQAGLLKPSVVKPVITTIEKGLVIKKLGQLQPADQDQLRQIVKTIIG